MNRLVSRLIEHLREVEYQDIELTAWREMFSEDGEGSVLRE